MNETLLIQRPSITAIADAIRAKSGKTDELTLEQMVTEIEGIEQGVGLPELTNEGSPGDLLYGKQLIDGEGNVVTGTIATKTASNLTASGATVTVPAGYYASQATKSVVTATQATPSISVNSSGLITASATQTAGYVSAGTKSATKQLTTQAAQTIIPGTTDKTIASGRYLTGTQTIKGDSNLIPANIVSGKSIFGVAGSAQVGSGGGTSSPGAVSAKAVNFYDYDGTVLHSYSVEEAQALTELPALPEHDGLICQGWNYNLATIKSYNREVNVGPMYTTDDGTTRIYIHLEEGRTSPMLGVCPKGTVTIDWGDGTTPNTLTGTSVSTVKWTPTHNYAAPGDYVIRLTVSGSMGFVGVNSSDQYACVLRYTSGADTRNYTYRNAVRKIEIGSSITSIGRYAFQSCYSLSSITIPSGVTSIGDHAFYYCHSLSSITIPSGITSIGSSVFQSCYSIRYYDFTNHTAVPTLSNTNAFSNIAADCEIRVPAALYDEWIAATNWSTYASYVVAV